jgi:hypothetical protein
MLRIQILLDPAFHFDTDPDPNSAFQFDADSDLTV